MSWICWYSRFKLCEEPVHKHAFWADGVIQHLCEKHDRQVQDGAIKTFKLLSNDEMIVWEILHS
jgi:hypothetical protein